MSRISGRINLAQLVGAVRTMKGQDGNVDCLVLPITQNFLYRGEKGIYLDLIAWELEKKGDSKDTHLVKQSIPKADRDLMSEDELRAMPILGNLAVWSDEPPVRSDMTPAPETDDLPF